MNLNELQAKLLASARKDPPSDHVPYAFEKRIMARLGHSLPFCAWSFWSQSLWRAALSCVAITLLCGLWSLASIHHNDSSESFSQAFEGAVFSSVDQHFEDAW